MSGSETVVKSTVQTKPPKRPNTRQLALLAIIAGVYAVTTVALGGISYGPLNLRFTNIILGVVPILGMPSVFGLALGVFFSNIASPLGPIDLVSAVFALVGLGAIYYLRNRSVILGLAVYTVIIGLWVTFELSFVLGIPYLPEFYYVTAGNAIVNALAFGFYKALNSTGIRMRLLKSRTEPHLEFSRRILRAAISGGWGK